MPPTPSTPSLTPSPLGTASPSRSLLLPNLLSGPHPFLPAQHLSRVGTCSVFFCTGLETPGNRTTLQISGELIKEGRHAWVFAGPCHRNFHVVFPVSVTSAPQEFAISTPLNIPRGGGRCNPRGETRPHGGPLRSAPTRAMCSGQWESSPELW